MNAKLRMLLLPLLRTVKAGKQPSFRNRSAAEQALFLIQKQRAPSARKKPARERKQKKIAGYQMDDAALKAAVSRRAGGLCELHPELMSLDCGHPGIEPHHLEGGSGRRALQWVGNVVWVCRVAHDAFHHRPEDFRAVVLDWCAKYGYPIPRRFRRPIPASAAPAADPPPESVAGAAARGGGSDTPETVAEKAQLARAVAYRFAELAAAVRKKP